MLQSLLTAFHCVACVLLRVTFSSLTLRKFFLNSFPPPASTYKLEGTGLNKESMGFCQVEGVFVLTSVGSATAFTKTSSLKNVAPSWTSGERSIQKWNVLSFSPSSDCVVPQFSSKVQGRPGIFNLFRATKMIGDTL